jgi:hypothetical protein
MTAVLFNMIAFPSKAFIPMLDEIILPLARKASLILIASSTCHVEHPYLCPVALVMLSIRICSADWSSH